MFEDRSRFKQQDSSAKMEFFKNVNKGSGSTTYFEVNEASGKPLRLIDKIGINSESYVNLLINATPQ